MPKASKSGHGSKKKIDGVPIAQRRKDIGVPKIQTGKLMGKQPMPYGRSKPLTGASSQSSASDITLIASTSQCEAGCSSVGSKSLYDPADPSLTTRDSSAKAFIRELRKVIDRSDVIIQVLDARDPDGTRSRWVEEEVRKKEGQGKKLLAVMNKIDLIPRGNLEIWLKHLRHSFPCMPFKSSTQNQRQNLSQNAVPIVHPASFPGQPVSLPPLPVTTSSLGAPALLHLLKQYSLSTPYSALTVGVVGYPNVGKSSLINSLKRSRACAVAAMPGKTRVVQEVLLDTKVKILDCPGVILEDFGREIEGEEGRRRQAEIMLRNCVKAELVEDPFAPVQVILSRVEPALLQKLYSIPPFEDVRDFLIKISLTRGRLGKGGVPDLEGSAVSVLRDWNSGKIPFYTIPPTIHPSSASGTRALQDDVEMDKGVGDARILNALSEAFTLDGLFDTAGDEAAWEGEEAFNHEAIAMVEDESLREDVAPSGFFSDPLSPVSDDDSPYTSVPAPANFPQQTRPVPLASRQPPAMTATRLFTSEELAVLPIDMLDRQKLKRQAKKAKKRFIATQKTEAELMLGFIGMDVEESESDLEESAPRIPVRKAKKAKKKASKSTPMEVDEELRKEADFAESLATIRASGHP